MTTEKIFDDIYLSKIRDSESELVNRLKALLKNQSYRGFYLKRIKETPNMVIEKLGIRRR